MKWHEKHGQTIDLAVAAMIGMLMVVLFTLLLFAGVRTYAASCLTIDVPPQAVIGVADGDTFTVFNLLPPGYVRVRVEGINTPERNQPGYLEAKQFTAAWLAKGTFQLFTCGKHTFERIVGVASRGNDTLAHALKAAGHSR